MQRLFQRGMVRFGLSLAALYISLVICYAERHFQLVLWHPSTYLTPLQHRCGLLLVATFLWAAYETLSLLRWVRPAPG